MGINAEILGDALQQLWKEHAGNPTTTGNSVVLMFDDLPRIAEIINAALITPVEERIKIEVRPFEKQFGLYVNEVLIGTSKSDSDCRFNQYQLEKALGL